MISTLRALAALSLLVISGCGDGLFDATALGGPRGKDARPDARPSVHDATPSAADDSSLRPADESCGEFNSEGGSLDLDDGTRLTIPRMALPATRTRVCLSRAPSPIRGALGDAATVRMKRIMTTNVLKLELPFAPEQFMGRPLRLGYLRFEDKGLRVWGLAPEPAPNTGSDPVAGILRGQVIADSLQEDATPDGGARPELPWRAILAPIVRCDTTPAPLCDCRGGICQ